MLLEILEHIKQCSEMVGYSTSIQRNDNELPFAEKSKKILLVRMGGLPSDKDLSNALFDVMIYTGQNASLDQLKTGYEDSLSLLKYLRHNHNRGTIHNIVVTSSVSGPHLDQTQRRFYSLSISASQT